MNDVCVKRCCVNRVQRHSGTRLVEEGQGRHKDLPSDNRVGDLPRPWTAGFTVFEATGKLLLTCS